MFYQRKMFFIHYCSDSNYYPGDWPKHPRLFLVPMYSVCCFLLLLL